MRQSFVLSAAVAVLSVLAPFAPAAAQEAPANYPSRPIRAITSSGPGGLSDIFMRALAEELRGKLGQPVIVENRPGGSMNVGTRACADAPPDGYSVCILHSEPVTFNQFVYKNLPFDPEKGLAPITNLYFMSQGLVVNGDLKVSTVDELVALSKAKPGTLNYLTASPTLALYMERLKEQKGADWVRVPFKSGGQAVNDLMSGSTPIALLGVGNVTGQIESGQVKLLAIGNEMRSPLYPKVPTMADTGYTGTPSSDWYGLFAPAGTPKAIVDRISTAVQAIVADPSFRDKQIISRGLVPAAGTPEDFARRIVHDRELAKQLVKDANLPVN